jgi:hypothetical protein
MRFLDQGCRAGDSPGSCGLRAGAPADGLVQAAGIGFTARAERVTAGGPWRCPSAPATWVTEVGKAMLDLIGGELPAAPAGRWFVDGLGRHEIPRAGPGVKPD